MKLRVSLGAFLAIFAMRLNAQCTFTTTDPTKITETCATAGIGFGVTTPAADLHVKGFFIGHGITSRWWAVS